MSDSPEVPKSPEVVATETIKSSLSSLTPDQRQSVLVGLFTENLANIDDVGFSTLSESMDQDRKRREEVQSQPTGEVPVAEPSNNTGEALSQDVEKTDAVASAETPEIRAQRLLQHVSKATFDSFQEYSYVATNSKNGFEVNKVKGTSESEPDDLLQIGNQTDSRSENVIRSLKESLKIPISDSAWDSSDHRKLYCVAGKKDGKFIVQGGGKIHADFGNRINASSFKLVFDSADSGQEFLQWLQENPNEALSATIERAIGQYTSEGEFVRSYLPAKKVAGSFENKNPFARPIDELRLRKLESGEEIARNYIGTDVYQQLATELQVAHEAFKEAERREREERMAQQKGPEPVVTPQAHSAPELPRRRGLFGGIFGGGNSSSN